MLLATSALLIVISVQAVTTIFIPGLASTLVI